MKKIKILLAFLFGLCSVFYAHAQTDNISPARKQAIDSLALEKVRDLSKYISIIGNKTIMELAFQLRMFCLNSFQMIFKIFIKPTP